MRRINFKVQILPHLIAILVFLLVTIAFFHPATLGNKTLDQHDIKQWKGSAQELMEYRQATGEEGLWTNSMFSGMPAYLVDVDWSNWPITTLHKILSLGLPHPVRLIFLAFLCYYIMLLIFKVRPMLAMAGAIAFGLSSFLIIGIAAGHNSRIGAMAFLPLLVGGVHLTFSGKRLLGFALTAVSLALHLRMNHLQVTYYAVIILLVYGLVMLAFAYREKTLTSFSKNAGLLLLAAVLALGTFFGEFWSISEYSKYSIRGPSELQASDSSTSQAGLDRDYAFYYSNGRWEALTLVIPNFYGGATQQALARDSNLGQALSKNGLSSAQIAQQVENVPTYWGAQPGAAPYYIGAVMAFLFVLGLMLAERKYVIWLVSIAILGILLAMGKNLEGFNYFLFDHLPGYNKFRSVTFALTLSIFAIPLLGILGLEKLCSQGMAGKSFKSFLIACGITGGFCLIASLLAGIGDYSGLVDARLGAPDWFIDALKEDRASLLRSDAFRSFILVALASGAIFFTLKGKISQYIGLSILILLVTFDLWSVSSRYLTEDNYQRRSRQQEFTPSAADQMILRDQNVHYRVLNLIDPFNDGLTSYFHKSIGGYHGAKLRRYQDVVEHGLQPELQEMFGLLQSGNVTGLMDFQLFNMLNAKYFKFGDQAEQVINNPGALGNSWLVGKSVAAQSPDEELSLLSGIDTKNEIVYDQQKFQLLQNTFDQSGHISLLEYRPNYLKYEFESSQPSLVAFSEIYYPKGWTSKIDGQETDHIRANYVLRAMEVPSGKHTIEFEFRPKVYRIGNPIMLVFSLILIVTLLGAIAVEVKKSFDSSKKQTKKPS